MFSLSRSYTITFIVNHKEMRFFWYIINDTQLKYHAFDVIHIVSIITSGARAIATKLSSSLQRVRKRSLPRRSRASTLGAQHTSTPDNDKLLASATLKHKIAAEPNTSPSPPDVLEGSPPTSEPDLMPTTIPRQSQRRHFSTLDSVPQRNRSSRLRTQANNPYHTPPRRVQRHANRQNAFDNPGSQDNLVYSSLTRRNMNVDYDSSISLLASAGPPPDIAPYPHPSHTRVTGTATPPDITSSPSNTWHAML